jgi:Cd2+/Zn2+-exporting ATPase
MARVKAIALDKTRTITYGSPIVSDFPLNGTSRQELLACTAGTEISLNIPWRKPLQAEEGFEPHKQKL